MKSLVSLLLCALVLPLSAAEETPLALKALSCKAVFAHLGLDTAAAGDVDLCLAGLHGIKGKTDAGLSMLYVGRPAAAAPAIIAETRIAKKNGAAMSSVIWCDTIRPESGTVDDPLALKAVVSAILQLMKELPRDQLPASHPVLTSIKVVAPPKNLPDARQFMVSVEERDMMRAATMGVVVDTAGKVLEMKILRSIP